jgi:hypothetical protein
MSSSSQAIPSNVPRVDTNQGKFTQGSTVLLTALAFLFNLPILILLTLVVMAWAVLFPAANPYRWLYQYIVIPLGLLKPRIVEDDPIPHRFAQGVGVVFLLAASIVLFFTHALVLGWTLDIIVFVLAGINLTIGFCAGCFVYYQLGRTGLLPKVRYEGSFHWRGV